MNGSMLEITENDYVIRLGKTDFDLAYIRSLMKFVELTRKDRQPDDLDVYFSGSDELAEPNYYGSLQEK